MEKPYWFLHPLLFCQAATALASDSAACRTAIRKPLREFFDLTYFLAQLQD
jgi:hypothetical protein